MGRASSRPSPPRYPSPASPAGRSANRSILHQPIAGSMDVHNRALLDAVPPRMEEPRSRRRHPGGAAPHGRGLSQCRLRALKGASSQRPGCGGGSSGGALRYWIRRRAGGELSRRDGAASPPANGERIESSAPPSRPRRGGTHQRTLPRRLSAPAAQAILPTPRGPLPGPHRRGPMRVAR